MDIFRLGAKFFAGNPAAVPLTDFIPVFHTWIQNQVIENHLLIDVHDYSHIKGGPGILLVAHEGNFSIDMAENRMGLLYYRKHPMTGPAKDSLTSVLKPALQACGILENERRFAGQLRFRTDELLIVANDRLNAPNDERTFSELGPFLSSAFERLFAGSRFTLSRASLNPRELFGVRVQTDQSSGTKTLMSRL